MLGHFSISSLPTLQGPHSFRTASQPEAASCLLPLRLTPAWPPPYKPGHGHCPPVLPLGFLPRFSQSHDGAEAFGAPFTAAAAEALTEVAGQYPEEWASLVAQLVKNPPAIPEGWE